MAKEAKRKREAKISHTMLTQDFDMKHWDWDDADMQSVQNQDEKAMGEIIRRKLESKGIRVKALYAVKHTKDTKMGWDEDVQQQVIVYKSNHGHWVAVLHEPAFLADIASAVGLEPQFVEKPKTGRYSCDNMLSYLIHIKDANKYQYQPEDVTTIVGDNYMGIYAERKEAWEKARAKKQSQEAKKDIEWLEAMILTGEIKKPQVLLTDEYFAIYAMNKRRCEDAFDTYAERKIYKTIQLMEAGAFKVSVFFITGQPGAGKSFFTDQLAKSLQEQAKEHGEDWEICSVAASNPFDEYRGEEILVMDDLRGMSLTASDWLKLLDPDRVNTGTARYRNKRMACRTIIINSEKDLVEFFFYMKGMGSTGSQEAMDQFFRRIMARAVVYCYKDGSRRVLIGNRTKTEPYSVQVADTKMSVTNTFSEDAFDMNYNDALRSLSLCVAYNNNWIDFDEKEKFDSEASNRGAVEKAGYIVAENEAYELKQKYNVWVDRYYKWAYEDLNRPECAEGNVSDYSIYPADFETWKEHYDANDYKWLNTIEYANGVKIYHDEED